MVSISTWASTTLILHGSQPLISKQLTPTLYSFAKEAFWSIIIFQTCHAWFYHYDIKAKAWIVITIKKTIHSCAKVAFWLIIIIPFGFWLHFCFPAHQRYPSCHHLPPLSGWSVPEVSGRGWQLVPHGVLPGRVWKALWKGQVLRRVWREYQIER